MKTPHIIVAAIVVSIIAAQAFAHGGATGMVKERMDAMSSMGKAMKAIAEMIRGKVPYDMQAIRMNAAAIKNHSGSAITKLFPENSLQSPSEARKEIWSSWDEFETLASRLETLASGLEMAAENNNITMDAQDSDITKLLSPGKLGEVNFAKISVSDVFKITAKTCTQCHEKFRLNKE